MSELSTSMDPAEEAILAAVMSDGSRPVVHSRSFKVMGSNASITVVGGHASLVDDAVGLAHELEGLWTRFSRESEISELNWAEGKAVSVDPRTRQLVSHMVEAHRLTGGLYDPTLLPQVLKSGYTKSLVDSRRETTLPESARAPGEVSQIHISGDSVQLPIGTTLDSGGIGKGFAADIICEFLKDRGALGAMVELGGDLRVEGYSPRGRGWRLGVENPLNEGAHVSIVEIESGGLATSSRLKRTFTSDDGKDTHHLIDPTTGESLESDVLTVTVLAPTSWQAEVVAKVGFSKSPAEFLQMVRKLGFRAGVVLSDGQWLRSSDWPEYRA